MERNVRVTVWNEFRHEKNNELSKKLYPRGMHAAIAEYLELQGCFDVGTATLDEPQHGLTAEVIENTDVTIWWGHIAHHEVEDEVVKRLQKRVLEGMGLIVLHSGHFSKIFKALMGTNCSLRWRAAGEKERLWNIAPNHPITEGIGDFIELPQTEMYGERFDVPAPQETIFISWFEGGEIFRSGLTFTRGHGKIFYFRPGHETFPVFHDEHVLKVIANAARWAAPRRFIKDSCPPVKIPLEKISNKH